MNTNTNENVHVEARSGEHSERVIKRFKRMCEKFGVRKEYRKRKEHVKKSIRLRLKSETAAKKRLKDQRRKKNTRSKL